MLSVSALASILVVFGSYFYYTRFTTPVAPGVPYANGDSLWSRLKVPILYGMDPVNFLISQRKKLGDMFCVDLLFVKFVFLLGTEGTKTLVRAAEDDMSFWEGVKWSMGPRMSGGVEDPDWVIAGSKGIKASFVKPDSLAKHAANAAHLPDEYATRWSQQDSVPLFKSCSDLLLAQMITILCGDDFFRRYGDEFTNAIRGQEHDIVNPLMRILPEFLKPLSSVGRRMEKRSNRLEGLVKEETARIFADPEMLNNREDYLAHLCRMHGPSKAHFFRPHILAMAIAGHTNAAMTLPWMFLHARRVPGALAKWKEEVKLGFDVKKPYIEACFRETGRMYSNLILLRRTKIPTTVKGSILPPGTFIIGSPLTNHYDETIFEEPTRWKPERFLKEGAYSEWFRKVQFVHFGGGIHACPGEKLVKMMTFDLILKTWMEGYEFEVVGGLEEGVKGLDGVGVEGTWGEHNLGTPWSRGGDVQVRVRKLVH